MQLLPISTRGSGFSRGFTIVELLIVLAIIGVLIAMLAPAINNARAAARRTQCLNNLHQIGLATLAYHNLYKHYPYWELTGGFGFRVAPGEKSNPNDRSGIPEKWGLQAELQKKFFNAPEMWICPAAPEYMRDYKNTYAFSTVEILKRDYVRDSSKVPWVWDNYTLKPYTSGFYRVKSDSALGFSLGLENQIAPHGSNLRGYVRGYNRILLDGRAEFFRIGDN